MVLQARFFAAIGMTAGFETASSHFVVDALAVLAAIDILLTALL
jgi:hypothetical protein